MITIGDQSYQMVSHDTTWYPTTSTTPSTPTNTNTSATTAAAATTTEMDEFAATTAAADRNVDIVGGELGKGVIALSTAQVGDLLDQMGIDAFSYYVDKLSCFIIKNNAKVKNHYDTILKWWKEALRCAAGVPESFRLHQ